ncbi:ATP-binding cassette domain-containing protein [Actinokineospora sp. G85]|uniref:ATP-binding cassette domain-containing protein n=1 Tax=Actinokineospora sp. G85 TaxID=3406626 RepID=UPI003C70B59C
MIRTRGLTRHFTVKNDQVDAVRGLDVEVAAGEAVAFLGPNGAGKTTSMRMLCTLLPPSSGTAEVAGHDVVAAAHEVRLRIGYLGQGGSGGHNHLVRDELYAQGRFHGMSRGLARRRAGEVAEALDLTGLGKRRVGTLSGGQRRRVDVAMALVHQPGLLFLDEPSAGLDPQGRAALWELIGRLRADLGTTIFFCTHYLEEADRFADRVVVVDGGRVIADDTPDRLKADQAGDRVLLTTHDTATAATAAAIARRLPGVRDASAEGDRVTVRATRGDTALPELIRALDAAGVAPRSADLRRPTLDNVFLGLTGKSMREDAA